MSVDLLEKPSIPSLFPAAVVEARLRELLLEAAEEVVAFKGESLPADLSAKYAALVQLDSLTVVGMLCELDTILGIELKDNTVRTGGYRSINEAIDHLLPRINAAWAKHPKGK